MNELSTVLQTLRSNANGAKKPASDLKPQHAAHSASADGTTTTTHGTSGLDEADADDDLDFLEDSDLLALLDSATPSISRADGATAKPITTQTSSKRKSDDTQKENICPVRAKTPRQSPERSRTQRNTPHGAPYQSDGRQAHTEQTHSNRQITRSYVGHSHSQSNESVDGCVGRGRGDDGGALRSGDVRTQNVHAPHRQQQSHPQRTLPQSQMREQARARIQQQPQTSTREQTQTQPANGPLHSPLSQQQPHHIRRQTKHSTPPQLQARRRTQPQQQAQHNPQMNGSLEILLSQPQTTVRQSTTTPQDCLATPNTPAVYSQGLQHLLRTRGSDGEGPGHTLHNSQSNVSLAGQRSGKPSQQRTHSSPHTQQNGIGTRQNTSRQLCVYPQEPTRAEGGCLDTLVRKGAEIPYSSHSSRPPASFRARGTHGAANIETGCVSGSRHQKYLQPTGNITAELVTESTRTETNTHNLISAPRSENRVTNAPNSGTRPSSGPITSGGSGAKYYNLLLDGPRSSSTTRTDVREDEPDRLRLQVSRHTATSSDHQHTSSIPIPSTQAIPRPPAPSATQRPTGTDFALIQLPARKFPGPAGRLPPRSSGLGIDEIIPKNPGGKDRKSLGKGGRNRLTMCGPSVSYDNSPLCEDYTSRTGGWVAMLQYTCLLRNYQYFCKGDRLALKNTMLAYSIQYIVDLAVMCKIPYLAVMVRSLANPGSRVCTIFRDPSGEIPGELHRKVLQRYHDLRVGDVMVLKNVSVLYPNPTECFLNITLNNIDRVFSHKGEDLTATTENHEQTGTERQRASRLESNSRGTHRNK